MLSVPVVIRSHWSGAAALVISVVVAPVCTCVWWSGFRVCICVVCDCECRVVWLIL